MQSQEPFSSFLQGDGTLLIRCAEVLLEHGHIIHGIITSNEVIQHWADAHQIDCLDPSDNFAARLQAQPFDYFFSIANLSIIPNEILTLPRKAAINFHDGPLPRYAGLYATSWALFHQEVSHGVTWHLMGEAIDAGDIVKQRLFAIDPSETAFTLNSKCYEHGAETFAELVEELAAGRVQAVPQTASERHYFGKYDRPQAVLEWNKPASEIAALVRALDFGHYPNPLTLPKIDAGGQFFVVSALEVLNVASSDVEPGTITALDKHQLRIATATNEVAIEELFSLEGKPLSIEDFAVRTGLRVADRLPVVDDALARRFTDLTKSLARHEAFWLKRLDSLAFPKIPYSNPARQSAGQFANLDLTWAIPEAIHDDGVNYQDLITAAFMLFVARVGGSEQFDLGFSYPALRQPGPGLETLTASQIPLRAAFDLDQSAEAALQQAVAEIVQARKHVTFPRDLIARYPELKSTDSAASLPVVIEQVEQPDDYTLQSGCQLAVLVWGNQCRWVYDPGVFSAESIAAMQSHFTTCLTNLLGEYRDRPLSQIPLLSAEEQRRVLVDWNATQKAYPRDLCIHQLFEHQVGLTPDAVAIAFENQEMTYRELNRRANQLARSLRKSGVGPDHKVGLYMERSLEMMVGLLAILKSGGAYVPLDSTYPKDRIAFMLADAEPAVLLTQSRLTNKLPKIAAPVVRVDADWPEIALEADTNLDSGVQPHHLCYMIYTSGSTGNPKGVMVEHRNVVNFFVGMDDHIPHEQPGVWLAVTSLSFDISVLELLWTLTRGFRVVLHSDSHKQVSAPAQTLRPIDFSLFYFASYQAGDDEDKYRLLMEGVKYADQHGFAAVWTPERHFGDFGGLFPNPAVTSAAIAAVTKQIQIRAGSCVSPLHHPVRIAEDWALVDNLSNGRVGISFASGWQPKDFVLKPENFADRKAQMFRDIETVHRLWRGETVTFDGPQGETSVRTLPRPVQPELPTWVTIAGNPETFQQAGAAGYNVLTHLLGQTLEQLSEKLEAYHGAWREHGHPGRGHVTLMLHTFVGDNVDEVREIVRQPMINYLASALDLTEQAAWSFPAFKERAQSTGMSLKQMFEAQELTEDEKQAILTHAFERYFETSGLFGDVDTCLAMVNRLKAIGVDEIGCLVDFGVPTETALAHLEHLNRLREMASVPSGDYSIPALIAQHGVTHMQCTPSMAEMLTIDEAQAAAFTSLKMLFIGGEAFPVALANKLRGLVSGQILNMYGPTETTIWSAIYPLNVVEDVVPIGRPIANTTLYILDAHVQPVPVGMPGELYIGGEGVVRGYWNRPEMTSERFIADPFSHHDGTRLYKTGDMARYLPDGNIEFLGRNDHQVKIRGYRIELGEIETLLDQQPDVQKAVVVAREDLAGDKRLVAYVVSRNGHAPAGSELRNYLRDRLPEFMVPAHYVMLDSFPLTPNKKIDRKALPAPNQVAVEQLENAFVPPQDPLGQQIAAIWQDLLGLPSVGIHDNFFDLGGHSLLAVQAHRRICEATGKAFAVTDLFRFTTIDGLVRYLSDQEPATHAVAAGLDKSLSRAERRKQRMERR